MQLKHPAIHSQASACNLVLSKCPFRFNFLRTAVHAVRKWCYESGDSEIHVNCVRWYNSGLREVSSSLYWIFHTYVEHNNHIKRHRINFNHPFIWHIGNRFVRYHVRELQEEDVSCTSVQRLQMVAKFQRRKNRVADCSDLECEKS